MNYENKKQNEAGIKPAFADLQSTVLSLYYSFNLILQLLRNYFPKRIRKVTIRPNKAIASVKAKPNKAYVNRTFNKDGLRAILITREAKTTPTPTPAPIKLDAAHPAPIILAALINIVFNKKEDNNL